MATVYPKATAQGTYPGFNSVSLLITFRVQADKPWGRICSQIFIQTQGIV